MAGAVPTFLKAVPVDDAADVRANGAPFGQRSILGAVDGVLGHAAPTLKPVEAKVTPDMLPEIEEAVR